METKASTFMYLILLGFMAMGCNPLGGSHPFTGENYHPGFVLVGDLDLQPMPEFIRGGEDFSLSVRVSSEVTEAKLLISYDGGTSFAEMSALTSNQATYLWSVPDDQDGQDIVLKVTGLSKQGTPLETHTNVFRIDSVVPGVPQINLISATLTNSRNVSVGIASCTDRNFIFIKESSSAPSRDAAGWVSCSSSLAYELSSAQGVKTVYVFAKDLAGHVSGESHLALTYDSVAPNAPTATLHSSAVSNSLSSTLTLSNCLDTDAVIVTESSSAPALSDAGWAACSTGAGAITHTFSSSTQGSRSLYVWAKDAAGNRSGATTITRVLDQNPPVLQEVVINPAGPLDTIGDLYTGTANVMVRVKASDTLSPFSLRVMEVSSLNGCEAQYVEGTWTSYSLTQYITVAPIDGDKKICVWAKDEAGNKSVIDGLTPELAGINMDTIRYEVGNIPQVIKFTAKNKNDNTTDFLQGEPAEISFELEDFEGLNLNPVSIAYTVNNTSWLDLHSGLDTSVPTNVTWFGSLSSEDPTYNGQLDFPAPSNGYFKFRITAKDRAGNTSVAIYSDAMNGSPWSVYAGSTDTGDNGTALAARFLMASGSYPHFAISPKNNDLYVLDQVTPNSLRKLDSRTGLITAFIKAGTLNLTHGGTLPATLRLPTITAIKFDSVGNLFVSSSSGLWKLDLENNKSYLYRDPSGWAGSGGWTFDEDDSLYYFENCTNGQVAVRIMKLTHDNGAPDQLIHIAGNCQEGDPSGTGPLDPKNMPLGTQYSSNGAPQDPSNGLNSLAVWERGKYIYYHYYNGNGANKILDGVWYKSNLPSSSIDSYYYNRHDQKLYGFNGAIKQYVLNLTGPNGDTAGAVDFISATNSGACGRDDVPRAQACVRSNLNADVTSSGILLFGDGAVNNSPGTFRVRYVDPGTQKMKTLAGSLPFYGDGLSKNLVRGDMAGIHYKKTSTPGFPAGLYFVDKSALVLGRINSADQKVNLMFGDQTLRDLSIVDEEEVSTSTSLGKAYAHGDGKAFMIDELGNPWFRADSKLYSVSYDSMTQKYKLHHRMTGPSGWGQANEGADPKNYRLTVGGGKDNLVGTSKGIFIIGVQQTTAPGLNLKPAIRYFDFENNTTRKIMGSETSETPTSAPDSTDPLEEIKDLPVKCGYVEGCYLYYDSVRDTLYFRENSGNYIRYITDVLDTDPTVPKLHTINLSRRPLNYTFRPNHPNELYYISGNKLYCKNITGSGCSDATDLGPNSLIGTIVAETNQLTWMDDDTLLISGATGVILKYQVE